MQESIHDTSTFINTQFPIYKKLFPMEYSSGEISEVHQYLVP